MLLNKEKMRSCKKECYGTVIKAGKDIFGPTVMKVEYCVNGKTYVIKEAILSKTPAGYSNLQQVIGKNATTRIPNLKVGKRVTVRYNAEDPGMAYVKENR